MDFNAIDCFRDLDLTQQERLRQATTEIFVASGEPLVHEGDASNSMYFVVSGRFAVSISSQPLPIAHIGAGQSIGEIGFLSGDARTATATAVRDSVVLRLRRSDYDMLCTTFPQLLHDISRSLARKLAGATARYKSPPSALARAITICPAGNSPLTEQWIEQFSTALLHYGSCVILRAEQFPDTLVDNGNGDLARQLNEKESRFEQVVYIASGKHDSWTSLAFRQSDLVLVVADNRLDQPQELAPNAAERSLQTLPSAPPCWLVVCNQQQPAATLTGRWIAQRNVAHFHHVNTRSSDIRQNGFARLGRFICGSATGLIASGGGAFTAAHTGCFRAFEEAGIEFDIVGGASGGSAMLAALAAGLDHQQLTDSTEQMMVQSGALRKLTVPVYSLLDHNYFDRCLRDNYGDRRIEDNWLRFFAVSTNLTTGEEVLHDRGPMWQAVRASSSIPGLLPPLVADNGDLLVDGSILDSVPVKRMKSVKQGPSIILCFEPNHRSRTDVPYEKLPNRKALLYQLLRNRSLKPDINMPGIGSVLTQSMLLNNNSLELADDTDLILNMSLPANLKLNDWHRHREIADIGYHLARDWLSALDDQSLLAPFT